MWLIVALSLLFLPVPMAAQGVTTAGILGTIDDGAGQAIAAVVHVSNDATGFSVVARASGGRFLVQGLEPGGPYTITVRSIGHEPQVARAVFLSLGELSEMHFVLERIGASLDTVTVVGEVELFRRGSLAGGSSGLTIPALMLDRLPTLNRDLYDFVRLVPQVSTRIGLPNTGMSAGGVGFRFNNFLINGVSDRTLSGGVSGAFAGGKSIPLDAVQEYQVLVSSYDVRYGDFAGALVNAVTKSGTNAIHGSVFALGRNDRLARRGGGASPHEKGQYGLSIGGPIIRNRLHFFIAPEIQQAAVPAPGPYVGQPDAAERPLPVSVADLERLETALRAHGLTPGSAGPATNDNPLRNLFTRFDLALPAQNSRLVAWNNFGGSRNDVFSRADTFALSSYRPTTVGQFVTTALHLHTMLPRAGGGHNELLVSHRSNSVRADAAVQQPIVRVSVPAVSGGSVTINTGTHANAQGPGFRVKALAISDNLTIPLGASHLVTGGAEVERFTIRRGEAGGSYGAWSFATLSDLELGIADRYELNVRFGDPDPPLAGTQYGAHLGDRWQATERLSLTAGIRADLLAIDGRAPYHPLVDSLFDRRTDEMPRRRVELSPRLGFVLDLPGAQRQSIRGGVGVFTSRYPLGWIHAALSSYGVGGILRCNSAGGGQSPPVFDPDHRSAPRACAGGTAVTDSQPGDVDLLARDLRMMRVLRWSLAHDRQLPWNLTLVNEAVSTRGLSDFVLVNLNLPAPQASDIHGRVMYGAIPRSGIVPSRSRSPFTEVIELRNTGNNRSYQLSTRLEKARTAGISGSLSYTYSSARDVQTPLRVGTRGTPAWAISRATSGRHDDLSASRSSNDMPHRVVAAGVFSIPRTGGRAELALYYVGESGRPFTYVASGTLRRGDLNADGSNINDPIYVPRNALDTIEVRFSGIADAIGADNSPAAQAERELTQRYAFEQFIERTTCLGRQRGRILERNSCREPWSNTTAASIRQVILVAGRTVEAQLDVFNILNLLHSDWGQRREAAPALLEHVGQTDAPIEASRPIFRFDSTDPGWTTVAAESAFQLQLGLRYRF